jgi:hypothetical protein
MAQASIDVATSGDKTIVSGVVGKSIRVVSYLLLAASAVTAQWKSGTPGGTNLSGALPLITGIPVSPAGLVQTQGQEIALFTTNKGDDLVLNLGGNVQVSGHVGFVFLP